MLSDVVQQDYQIQDQAVMFQFSSEILQILKGQIWCPGLNLHIKEQQKCSPPQQQEKTLAHFHILSI